VESYNPAQRRVIELLGRSESAPVFDADVGERLRADVEAAIAPHVDMLGGERLFVSKHALAQMHGCEAHHLATRDTFEWSLATVRGSVAHKAIELSIHWRGEPYPAELVDEAIARLVNDDMGPGPFLGTLGTGDLAQLRGEVNDLVAGFLECFPPLRASWTPVTESRVRVELCDGLVVLSGKVDLTLGRHQGNGKVIIDLKSGFGSPTHKEDLRFYALIEAIKLGVPPRLVATYELDTARPHPEEVTDAVLQSALARTIDGVIKLIELHDGRPPLVRPGPPCRWCPLSTTCPEGIAHLASASERR
jgi:hypothetical protein